tara:strand:- start:3994 stop:4434 length:441 start_codon:yes stop_codon:yes gene_type:complete
MSSLSNKLKHIIKNYWHYILILLMLLSNLCHYKESTELFTQSLSQEQVEKISPENKIKQSISDTANIIKTEYNFSSDFDMIDKDPSYIHLKHVLDQGFKPPDSIDLTDKDKLGDVITGVLTSTTHLLKYTHDYIDLLNDLKKNASD